MRHLLTNNRLLLRNFLFASLLLISSMHIFADSAKLEAQGNLELYLAGEGLYELNCLLCHGENMLSPAGPGLDLRQFPKDDQQGFFYSLINGKGYMPAFAGVLSEQEILQLWIYVSNYSIKK